MLGLHGKGPGHVQHDHDRSDGTDDGQHHSDGDDLETLHVYSRANGKLAVAGVHECPGNRLMAHMVQPDDGVGDRLRISDRIRHKAPDRQWVMQQET